MENGQYGKRNRSRFRVAPKADTNDFQVPGSIWFYAPNKGAPVFFAFMFAISMLIHGYQCMSVIRHFPVLLV